MSNFENVDDFLFGGNENAGMETFDKKPVSQDGVYRPKLDNAKDKKAGYKAVIRFLPNITKEGVGSINAIETPTHYVKLNNENLDGYYECGKGPGKKCEICTTYWKLFNSTNAAEKEKADLIKRSPNFYSYVMIMEDENQPELVGKVMLFKYGKQISDKITLEKNGEVTGVPCNVFSLARGKDFKLIIKDKGGFANYEMSTFLESSPIKLWSDKNKVFKTVPLNENGEIASKEVQAKIKEVLMKRDVNIEDYAPKGWDDETYAKVKQITSIITGNDVFEASQSSRTGGAASGSAKQNRTTSFDDEKPVNTGGAAKGGASDFFELD